MRGSELSRRCGKGLPFAVRRVVEDFYIEFDPKMEEEIR